MSEKKDNDYIIINSYSKVWNIEQKIYAFFNFVLPAPILPMELLYFTGVFSVFFILSKFIFFISVLPTLIKYVIIPYLITRFLVRKKVDGKNPIAFFIDYCLFLLNYNEYIEKMAIHKWKKEEYKVNWNVTKRDSFF